jgi:hypothetical protein
METDNTETQIDRVYAGGFVTGLLTARYWHLRNSAKGDFFRNPVPTETPLIVYAILSNMCRSAIDSRLFETQGFREIDALLLCETENELHAALRTVPDRRIQ